MVLSNKKFNIVNIMNKPEPTPINKYIDKIVELIANKEGECSRNRKSDKVEFWIGRPNYTIVVVISNDELHRCMNLACYPNNLLKYIE